MSLSPIARPPGFPLQVSLLSWCLNDEELGYLGSWSFPSLLIEKTWLTVLMPLCQYTCNLRRGSQYPTALKGRSKKHQKNDISRNKHPNGIGGALHSETTSYLSRPRNIKELGALRPPHLAGSRGGSGRFIWKECQSWKVFCWAVLSSRKPRSLCSGKHLLLQVTAPLRSGETGPSLCCLPEITSCLPRSACRRGVLTRPHHGVSALYPPLVISWHFF